MIYGYTGCTAAARRQGHRTTKHVFASALLARRPRWSVAETYHRRSRAQAVRDKYVAGLIYIRDKHLPTETIATDPPSGRLAYFTSIAAPTTPICPTASGALLFARIAMDASIAASAFWRSDCAVDEDRAVAFVGNPLRMGVGDH